MYPYPKVMRFTHTELQCFGDCTRCRLVLFCTATPNLPTNIVDFRAFDSSTILTLRGGVLMSIRDFPESLTQAMLLGIVLVGRLGVQLQYATK